MSIFVFVLAILLLCVAHIIRVYRWKLFIDIYEKSQFGNLMRALAVGYFINSIFPFKVGDIVRALVAGHKMKNRFSLSFSSVIIDRYLDIIVIGLIFSLIYVFNVDLRIRISNEKNFYIICSVILLFAPFLIYSLKDIFKNLSCNIAKIFNQNIEMHILQFIWALIWNFKDIILKINKIKLGLSTIFMWMIYFSSYYCFAKSLNLRGVEYSLLDTFLCLFSANSLKYSNIISINFSKISIDFVIYMFVPLIILLVFSKFLKMNFLENNEIEDCLNLLPHIDNKERLFFLEEYFSNNKSREFIKTYLEINQNVSIIQDFSAGSNATTMLCMNNNTMFYRKYAFNQDAKKLYEQIKWIDENNELLPLPNILNRSNNSMYCYYDMEYLPNSVNFFEYIHSMPIQNSWEILEDILKLLDCALYKNNVINDSMLIDEYIDNKVIKNIKKIESTKNIYSLLKYKTLFINGVEYPNLKYYYTYLSKDYLKEVFKNDNCSVIHGDLTIENIICLKESDKRKFYLIDPNTGNIHNSPNLDYAKLLQSIHGGYEFLMRTNNLKQYQNKIDFIYTKSSKYIELHKKLLDYMLNNFGKECTKSIYFHEIIHWLRLLPYKIEKNEHTALVFYAQMLIVLNDVIKMCERGQL